MIKCPYCQHDLADDALSCPRCRGRLMEAGESSETHAPKLTTGGRFLHPYAALAYLVVLTALILVGFHKPRTKPTAAVPAPAKVAKTTPAPTPAATSQPEEEAGGTAEEPEAGSTVESPAVAPAAGRPDREQRMQERQERLAAKGKRGRRDSVPVASASEYEKLIKENLAKSDQLVTKFNNLAAKAKEPNGVKDLNAALEEFRGLLQQVRALQAPAGYERAQTTLSNSVALTRRGLRSKMIYLETGEAAQLSKSQEDLEAAKKQREQGLALLQGQNPPAPAAAPPPAASTPPPPPPPAKPAVAPKRPAPPPPPEVEPEPEPESGTTANEQPEGGNPDEPQPANPDEQPPPEQ